MSGKPVIRNSKNPGIRESENLKIKKSNLQLFSVTAYEITLSSFYNTLNK